jgi:hypothetical protein
VFQMRRKGVWGLSRGPTRCSAMPAPAWLAPPVTDLGWVVANIRSDDPSHPTDCLCLGNPWSCRLGLERGEGDEGVVALGRVLSPYGPGTQQGFPHRGGQGCRGACTPVDRPTRRCCGQSRGKHWPQAPPLKNGMVLACTAWDGPCSCITMYNHAPREPTCSPMN